MALHELFVDLQVSMLAREDGGDAIRLASVLAEAVLKSLLGEDAAARAGLGEMIGGVSRDEPLRERLGKPLLSELNWLNELRKRTVHFKGQFVRASIDDGKRAAEAVRELMLRAGQADADELRRLVKDGERRASMPADSSVLRLDRTSQRASLDDLLGLDRRVLALLLDGEVGQGHDHFAEVMGWRLRAVLRGQWREHRITWPRESESTATRLAALLESVATELEVALRLPEVDPLSAAGGPAWDAALAPLIDRIARGQRRLCMHHTIWVSGGDDVLLEHYLRRVWVPVAERPGERVVLSFQAQRAQASGMPLISKAWRVSQRERKLAEALARRLDGVDAGELRSATLAELTSVSLADLELWLRDERKQSREAAHKDAESMLAATDGGRFEQIVKRVASLAKDKKP